MQLREIMTTDVEVIRPETSVSEAAQRCVHSTWARCQFAKANNWGECWPIAILPSGPPLSGMTPTRRPCAITWLSDLICCFEDQDIKEAEEPHAAKRRLPVADPHTRETNLRDCGAGRSGKQNRRSLVTHRLLDSQESRGSFANVSTRACARRSRSRKGVS